MLTSLLSCSSRPPFQFHLPHHHHLLRPTTIPMKKTPIPMKSIIHPPPKPTTLRLFHLHLQLYVNAALMQEAQNLFDEMPHRTLITWTILMSGYIHNDPVKTLRLFCVMIQDHTNLLSTPDSFVYAVVLRACAASRDINFGQQVHSRVLKTDGISDLYVENALIKMYANCASLLDSARIFAGIKRPDLVSWSSMLSGYVQNGLEEKGLRLFVEMIQTGIRPDVSAFSIVMGASTNLGLFNFGIQVHCYVIKMGFHSCLFLDNTLMNFYAKCGDMGSSLEIFGMVSERDLVSWNTIIAGCIHNLHNNEALRVFRALTIEEYKCDDFTLGSVLQAITRLRVLGLGREVHGYIIRAEFQSNLYVVSSLLDMYIECIDDQSLYEVPVKIFNRLEDGQTDEFIISNILKWCALQSDLETGQALHSQIIKLDFQSNSYVVSSLLDMYSKCGIPEAAQRVFERIRVKGVVPWSVIIASYCSNGWFEEALRHFQQMQFDSVEANEYIYISILLACLALSDLKKGHQIHCQILRTGYGSNASVINSLVNLYSELLCPRRALGLCSLIPESDISWSSLTKACMKIQDHETLFEILYRVQHSCGMLETASVCDILQVCANPVLLNVGMQVQAYVTKRGLMSDPLTSNSLIEMYAGCGVIADALAAFHSMPEKNSDSWTQIISANVDHGRPFEALELYAQMCRKKKMLNSRTFVAILKAFASTGQVDEAFCLFRSMDRIHGIEPSIEHHSCMVEVLGRSGLFEDALEFIVSAIPFKPLPLVWGSLLSSSRIHGNMKVAKYAVKKLLEIDPTDLTASLLLKHILLNEGTWDNVSKLKSTEKLIKENSSWIQIRNNVHEFTSAQIPSADIASKLLEIEVAMEEMGYVPDRNHLLHNAEEEEYEGVGNHHTEMKALAFGLLSLPPGIPIRVIKSIRICGDCHSAFKFISTFLNRELFVKDSGNFHHFSGGKCSCEDRW